MRCMPPRDGQARANHAYFPILVDAEFPLDRDGLYHLMRRRGIHVRRYFYPLISDFPMYRGLASADPALLPVAREAAQKVLCLPIYPDLDDEGVEAVCAVIQEASLGAHGP